MGPIPTPTSSSNSNSLSLSLSTEVAVLVTTVRTRPGRTLVYTVLSIVAAVAQLGSGYYHGIALSYSVAFAIGLCSLSVLVTRHHVVRVPPRDAQRAVGVGVTRDRVAFK